MYFPPRIFFLRWRCPSPKDNKRKGQLRISQSLMAKGHCWNWGATGLHSMVLAEFRYFWLWANALNNFLLMMLFAFQNKLNTAQVDTQSFLLERQKGIIYILSLSLVSVSWLFPAASCSALEAWREFHSQNRRSNGFSMLAKIRSLFSGWPGLHLRLLQLNLSYN